MMNFSDPVTLTVYGILGLVLVFMLTTFVRETGRAKAKVGAGPGFAASPGTAAVSSSPVAARPSPSSTSLRLACDNSLNCVKRTSDDWGDGKKSRQFLQVLVYNDGFSPVEDCKVTLHKVIKVAPGGGGGKPLNLNVGGLLIWSGEAKAKPDGKRLDNSKKPEVADLFYTSHNLKEDAIALRDERNTKLLTYNNVYEFHVGVTARNTKALSRVVKVRFGKAWDDFEVLPD